MTCSTSEVAALLLVRLSKVLLRLGKLVGSLVELLLKLGCRGAVTARSRCLVAALELRGLGAGRLHCFTACHCPAP